MVCFLALWALAATPTLQLEVSAAEVSGCDVRAELEHVITERLAGTAGTSSERFTLSLSPTVDSGTWTLELRDPSNRPVLERALNVEPGGCVALAQLAALVTERYFDELNWRGMDLAPAEARVVWSVAAGPAFWSGYPASGALGASLSVGARKGSWRLGVSIDAASASTHTFDVRNLDARMSTLPLRSELAGAYCFDVLCAGVALGVRLTRAEASGELRQLRIAWLALPSAGAFARAEVPLTERLFVAGSLGISAPLGSGQFLIEGVSSVRTPALDAVASAQLGWRLEPR